MSIGGISSSFGISSANLWPDGLPRILEEQMAAKRLELSRNAVALSTDLPETFFGTTSTPRTESEKTRVIGSDGAVVAVTQQPVVVDQPEIFTLHLGKEPEQLDLEFTGNLCISKTEDGLYSVFFSEENVTRTYAADGSCTEVFGDSTNADTGRIYIATTNEAIQGGTGNDTFLVYGNGSIDTGGGNNTVILKHPAASSEITTGNGNSRITCENNYFGSMTLGDGDNTVSIGTLAGFGFIDVGHGNSYLAIGKMVGGSIGALGPRTKEHPPERILQIGSMSGNSSLSLHKGRNTIDVGTLSGKAKISLFDGSATIGIGHMGEMSQINCDARTSTVSIQTMAGDARLQVGGNSSVRLDTMSGSAEMEITNSPGYLVRHEWDENGLPIRSGKMGSSEVFVGEMRDGVTLSFLGSDHMIAILAMYDDAALVRIPSDWLGADSESTVVVGNAGETARLPGEGDNIHLLSELDEEDMEAIATMLAKWREHREEAGYPPAREDLMAALNEELSQEEEMVQRVALLMHWT